MLIKRIIAQCPKNSRHLCQDFNLTHSLRASSPIWEAPRSRVLARLPSLAQIGELARRLSNARPAEKSIPSSTYEVPFEPYLKAFQYKVLNSILFTNKKLCKIGYTQDDKCSLCKTDQESLYHIFFECSRHTKQYWKEFQDYYYTLTREFVCLTLQDVITGILYTNCPLLNYLILIAKLCKLSL